MRQTMQGVMLATLLALSAGHAQAKPPIVTAEARAEAARLAAMPISDPTSRMRIMLAARELDDAGLFALAEIHPGLVEQLMDPQSRRAIDYIAELPPPELHRVRQGETIIRSARSMTPSERRRVDEIVSNMGIKPKKFQAIRLGPLEGRIFRVEVTALGKKKRTIAQSLELAWPSTPERDDQSRDYLARRFGARPSQVGIGAGSRLPLEDGSFEEARLGEHWQLKQGVRLGLNVPVNDVALDNQIAIDGIRSLRFYGDETTRLFMAASQQITVVPGMRFVARAQIRTNNVRVEFQQTPGDVYMAVAFLDISGNPVTSPERVTTRMGTHDWETVQIEAEVPPGADLIELQLFSALSGTVWFDGVTLELR